MKASLNNEITNEQMLEWFQRILLIRRFEESAAKLAAEGKLTGGHPSYAGQECTAVPVMSQLRTDDYIFSTHRCSGHVLAKGGDPNRVMAELLGRATGYNGGKGGSYHVASAELGIPTTSAIVGANIALAGGAAFAAKTLRTGRVAVCMIGDSVPEEGSFYESVNLASLHSLPIVYICENNSGGITTPTLSVKEIVDTVKPFGIPSTVVDGSSVEEVYERSKVAIDRARSGNGPSFIEARTTVLTKGEGGPSHILSFETDLRIAWDDSIALPQEFRNWSENSDGLIRLLRDLINRGAITKEKAIKLDNEIKSDVERATRFALDSPWPKPESALEQVFSN